MTGSETGVATGTVRDETGVEIGTEVETGKEVETGTDRGETEVVTERGIVVARDRGETDPEAETEAAEGTGQEKGDLPSEIWDTMFAKNSV